MGSKEKSVHKAKTLLGETQRALALCGTSTDSYTVEKAKTTCKRCLNVIKHSEEKENQDTEAVCSFFQSIDDWLRSLIGRLFK